MIISKTVSRSSQIWYIPQSDIQLAAERLPLSLDTTPSCGGKVSSFPVLITWVSKHVADIAKLFNRSALRRMINILRTGQKVMSPKISILHCGFRLLATLYESQATTMMNSKRVCP
jgi:hypothetical protein